MNKVILTGNLTKDAELQYTPGKGTAVSKFTIAVTTGFGDNKKTAFIPIVVWGKTAEAVVNHTAKGSKVNIIGEIQTRNYKNKQDQTIYVTEVVADMYGGVEFLSTNKQSETYTQNATFDQMGFQQCNDDDIPF